MISLSDAKKLHNALFEAEEYLRCRQMWLRIQDKQLPFWVNLTSATNS